ncbi:MAG TPA: hypothetical protein VGK67_23815 [Myxococcales bacterium]
MSRPPRVGPESPRLADRDAEKRYQEVLGRWTRHAEIYDGLDSRLFLAATFQAMAFREARVERAAAFRSLPRTEAEMMLAADRKAHGEALEVVLGVYANDRHFDDLGRPDSIWKLALVAEAGEAAPLSVEKLESADPNLKALYPYLDTYWTAYRVRFPRAFENGAQVLPEKAQSLALRLSSAVGKAELRWDLAAPPATGAVAWP